MTTTAIVLAAGKGTRMRSALPKVLHPVCGRPMIFHVVDQLRLAGAKRIVVVVDDLKSEVASSLTGEFSSKVISFAVQKEALGTGDAARRGLKELKGERGRVWIVPGDVPLIRAETLKKLQRASKRAVVGLMTTMLDFPEGYGRIVRRGNRVEAIVEHRDATSEQKAIQEVNVGVYDVELAFLRKTLSKLKRDNAQGEFYLTDIVAAGADLGVGTHCVSDDSECRGANDRVQLAELDAILRERLIAEHQRAGVTFELPDSVVIEASVRLAQDVVIGAGVQLRGTTSIEEGVSVDGPAVITNSVIESEAHIRSFSHLENAVVGSGAEVGPYARLRPGTVLEPSSKVGNFVELKNTKLGQLAKVNHLAYVGDSEVGASANIGAGTITCNYDGTNKHRTSIGVGAFVGSNSTLVAPVDIGNGAYVAAGSTITKDVSADALAFGRARQSEREDHAKVLREKSKKD